MNQGDRGKSDANAATRTPGPTSLEELGRRLSAVLDRLESRARASEVAERSVDQLQKYVRGVVEPPFLPLVRLCEATGTRIEWLATGGLPMLKADQTAVVAGLDAYRLRAAIKLLDMACMVAGAEFDAALNVELIVEVYAWLAEQGDQFTPDNLIDFQQHLAQRIRNKS